MIKKTSETTPVAASVVNQKNNSTTDAYSCDYSNSHFGGVVLYEDETGTKTDVTLNDSLANYSYIDIQFKNTDGNYYFTNRCYAPDGKKIHMDYSNIASSVRYLFEKIYNCSGTSIAKVSCYQYNSSSNSYGVYDSFNIVKVIGYK